MKKIWAVTRNTIRQGIRMKVAIVVILFLLVTVPALPFLLKTDGTQQGQVRIVLTYSVSLASFLLSVLTLFLATAALCDEFKGKQIYVLDCKPVRRWQVLAGKWLGVMIVDAMLLVFMGGITYGLVRYLGRPLPGREFEHAVVRNTVLVGRKGLYPPPPEATKAVDEEYARLKKEKALPSGRSEEWIRNELYKRFHRQANIVRPLSARSWVFRGLSIPPEEQNASAAPVALPDKPALSIRYKHFASFTPPRKQLQGIWIVGPVGQREIVQVMFSMASRGQLGRVVPVSRKGRTFAYATLQKVTCDSFHEFAVPADVVEKDGTLRVTFINPVATQPAALFPGAEGIEVLFPVRSFAWNFICAMLMIFFKLGFLAAAGLFAATFLTFPVAALLALTILFFGVASPFVSEITRDVSVTGQGPVPPGTPAHWLDKVVRAAVQYVLLLFPNFSNCNPVPFLVDGRLVSLARLFPGSGCWALLKAAFGSLPVTPHVVQIAGSELLAVHGFFLVCLGSLIFHRREVAGLAQ